MTAWASIELAVQVMQSGGGDFVQKPWDNEKLLGSLRRQIEEGRLLREKKRQVEEARRMQERMLPAQMPKFSGFDVQTFWKPALDVGGDYFDAIPLTDSTAAFCIGDVAGKGLPAALLMTAMQASAHGLSKTVSDAAEMCRQLNRVVLNNTRSDRFTTFFYGILDSTRCSLQYSNAGHVPPILVRQDGRVARLSEGGTVLGLFSDADYERTEIDFGPGDRLVLVTDGITEATNSADEEFGEDRLIRLLVEQRHASSAELQQILLQAVAAFAGQALQDDATLMIVSMV
jgi:sigma-B regulation protein RsbU (phosphoserine phosphatase)